MSDKSIIPSEAARIELPLPALQLLVFIGTGTGWKTLAAIKTARPFQHKKDEAILNLAEMLLRHELIEARRYNEWSFRCRFGPSLALGSVTTLRADVVTLPHKGGAA